MIRALITFNLYCLYDSVFCYEYCLSNQNCGVLKELLFHLCTQGSATCYSVLWLKLSEVACKSDTLSFTLKAGHNVNNYFACMYHVSVASAIVYNILSLIHFPEVRIHETATCDKLKYMCWFYAHNFIFYFRNFICEVLCQSYGSRQRLWLNSPFVVVTVWISNNIARGSGTHQHLGKYEVIWIVE